MREGEATADRSVSLDAIFRENYAWLQRWLSRRVRPHQSAEDIAAETIARVVALSAQSAIREPRALMVTIARRILYDLSQKHDLHRAYEAALVHLPPALEPSAEERVITIQALQEIERKLRPLPYKARCAFLLYELDGMRHAEIAEVLGVSVSMVRKYIASAFRTCIEGALDHE
ncbi:RNA polymerase sigma-70 factor (ECF subfamily) [Rhizomicrobium palustre]|uniref:RNA polymerase sigma-70 factor (ECF subfamily) n=1 Tax=Rhizomicrobium palustre TaxID=189966 RepID=A0A846MYK3_9PROT|nr:sigma-70 family RNA polymerase sigma factor [Rhizomicrobium palustre]NIK88506.1 RNA polymerase sigma-70 factor (ECF subfamily) [Rhizomicrobium palustre]